MVLLCTHCPYVKHVLPAFAGLIREYQARGCAAVGYSFPFLYDRTQEVARAYYSACTPDFYLFDKDRALTHRGQMDGSRPGKGVPLTASDLRQALDAVLAGTAAPAGRGAAPKVTASLPL